MSTIPLMTIATIACAVIAAIILGAFILRRPPLTRATKLWLALGLGVFPLGAGLAGNVAGLQATQNREFCGSCHNMTPFLTEATRPENTNLAAIHTRNVRFGQESCETCHGDYGMFGAVTSKIDGMHHLWTYFTHFRNLPAPAAGGPKLKLPAPIPNSTCMQCHTTTLERFSDEPAHSVVLANIRSGKASCTSNGCHGPAHPTANGDKPPAQEAQR
jgi:cytochrome c-type protein NapC